ncbi:hypothetical protein BD324DRAFT_277955 [Kockovaella imperatae]|uniref:Uncharacterized protein n=1 Tax=Kockovaella imperatae TaxID=4999 RepID=A0A1Y1U681_9TREE|nr:hypothetical protein BD324DRAFT_277955 [Kockovaella imperatae]ORX33533.1 hypothetical protein BD324DRAFT_277955 [Kockovaella imperatae]
MATKTIHSVPDASLVQSVPSTSMVLSSRAPDALNAPSSGSTKLPNANRNKKRGFFKEMESLRGVRTTFDDDQGGSSSFVGTRDSAPSEPIQTHEAFIPDGTILAPKSTPSSSSRRYIRPPSEMVDLPSNVIVTSVEYSAQRSPASLTPNGKYRGAAFGHSAIPTSVQPSPAPEAATAAPCAQAATDDASRASTSHGHTSPSRTSHTDFTPDEFSAIWEQIEWHAFDKLESIVARSTYDDLRGQYLARMVSLLREVPGSDIL